jgi:hypothetical protein
VWIILPKGERKENTITELTFDESSLFLPSSSSSGGGGIGRIMSEMSHTAFAAATAAIAHGSRAPSASCERTCGGLQSSFSGRESHELPSSGFGELHNCKTVRNGRTGSSCSLCCTFLDTSLTSESGSIAKLKPNHEDLNPREQNLKSNKTQTTLLRCLNHAPTGAHNKAPADRPLQESWRKPKKRVGFSFVTHIALPRGAGVDLERSDLKEAKTCREACKVKSDPTSPPNL